MLFLDLFPSVQDFFSNIADIIDNALRGVAYSISVLIYKAISTFYEIFLAICRAKILDSAAIKSIAERIGLILGVVMLFMVAFSFIQIIIDPDKMTDKEMGLTNIVKKCLITIVMLGLSTYIFNFMTDIQDFVLDKNIIGNIILPNGVTVDQDLFGKKLSADLFTDFYRINDNAEDGTTYTVDDCTNNFNTLYTNIIDYNDFSYGRFCLNERSATQINSVSGNSNGDFIMDFNWIFCILAGIFALYFIIMYTISVGMRVIQLTTLQIISPMAILSYLMPKKDTMFQKWGKLYLSTYVDVFIRVGIINLATYVIGIILDNTDSDVFWNSIYNCTTVNGVSSCSYNPTGLAPIYIKVIMIIAILSFAKKAPDLLKQLFPTSGEGSIGFGSQPLGKALLGGTLGAGVYAAHSAINSGRDAVGYIKNGGLKEGFNQFKEGLDNTHGLGKAKYLLNSGLRGIGSGIRGAGSFAKGGLGTAWNSGKGSMDSKGVGGTLKSFGDNISTGWSSAAGGAQEVDRTYQVLTHLKGIVDDDKEVQHIKNIKTDIREGRLKDDDFVYLGNSQIKVSDLTQGPVGLDGNIQLYLDEAENNVINNDAEFRAALKAGEKVLGRKLNISSNSDLKNRTDEIKEQQGLNWKPSSK